MPLDTSQAKTSTVKSFPVVETVLSVQFEPTIAIHTAHLALLWQEYRERFPKTEERPPLDQVVEQFPEVPPARTDFRLQTLESLPVPRLWFLNDQGTEMFQVKR